MLCLEINCRDNDPRFFIAAILANNLSIYVFKYICYNTLVMEREFQLDDFQKEAIDYSRRGHSVIVSAPTGAGKTLIAEHIIEDCMKANKGVVYTAPIKALSNQKFRDFSKKYPGCVGILTGDVSINRTAPVLIMTTEIFRNAILVEEDEFRKREWIIFDEIHYLDDIERGTVWEETIILLPNHMRMLALSATIPNIDEFITWLGKVHNHPLRTVIEKERPVPLNFLFQCDNELFPNLSSLKKSQLLCSALKNRSYQESYNFSKPNRTRTLFKDIDQMNGLPAIYFSFSRKRCEILAHEASHLNFLSPSESNKIISQFEGLLAKFNISSSAHISFLNLILKRGIAYHHAGLLPTIKEIIEQLFTTGLIKLIFTTETFALGINMPAKTVVFDALSKFYARAHGYLKTRDFYQMAGRAGRRGIDSKGFVFSRVNPSHIDMKSLENIIYGNYEPIMSQLNSCYATCLNLYDLMGERIYDIYPKSFHFFQSKEWQKNQVLGLLKRKLALLKDFGYITGSGLSIKGKFVSSIYSFELAIGELFEDNFLDDLDGETLFVLVTALVYEPRKGQRRPDLNKPTKLLKRRMDSLIKDIHNRERKYRIYPLSKRFFFYLSEAARLWYHGAEFSALNKICHIDEGEIVRYFRMAIQVLRELYSSNQISNHLRQNIINCLKKVNRDVVDAEKQLRQEM
ncbi:MAG: DEAD/DEAH box helicase [Candidatus Omnitrophota bacterium]